MCYYQKIAKICFPFEKRRCKLLKSNFWYVQEHLQPEQLLFSGAAPLEQLFVSGTALLEQHLFSGAAPLEQLEVLGVLIKGTLVA